MKLLAPQQTSEVKASEQTRELLRMQEQSKEATKIRIELANAEADFAMVLAKNQKKWAAEEEAHQKDLAIMASEVQGLEKRKAQALIPAELQIKQATLLFKQATDKAILVDQREKELEEQFDLLQDKLDAVGQLGQDLDLREKQLVSRETGLKEQEQLSADRSRQVALELDHLAELKAAQEADIEKRRKELFLWQRSLEAKEASQARTDESLSTLAIQLKDERGTLDRALKRRS